MSLNLISLVDFSLVTTIANVLFFVILGLTLLGALLGMRKGIIRNTYKLVWNCVFIIIGIFVTAGISGTIGNIDISSYNISLTVGENVIVGTTVHETLTNVAMAMAGEDPATIQYWLLNEPSIISLFEQLVAMFISLFVFLIWMLLVVTIFKLIGFILYKLLIGPLFEKSKSKKENAGEEKKKKKSLLNKLGSLGIGFVNSIIVISMFISPLSSLINTVDNVGQKHNKEDGTPLSDDTYNNLMSFIEAYDNSILAQTFFITADKDGKTIDAKLMDLFANGELNGEKIYFYDEVTTLLDIGFSLIEEGVINSDGTFNQAALFGKDFMSYFLTVLIDSSLFTNLLSIIGNLAMNYLDAIKVLDINKIDLSSVSWSGELKNIKDIYNCLYDSGIITSLTDGTSTFGLPVENLEERAAFRNAFELIDKSDFLANIVPAIIHNYASQVDEEGNPTGLGVYLTSKWDDYKTIKWGKELCIIYDFVTGLYDVADVNINDLLFSSSSSEETEESSEKKHLNNITRKEAESSSIIDDLLKGENFTKVISLITGIQESGLTYDRDSFLLDSDIIFCSFDKLMDQVYDLLASMQEGAFSETDRNNYDEVIKSLNTKSSVCTEFNSLLYATKYLVVDSGLTEGSLDLNNDTQKEALKKSGTYIDQSKILSTVVPSLLEKMTSTLDFGSEIPISGSDLNFRNIKYGEELGLLLDCYSDILDLSDSLSGETASDIISGLKVDKLENVLKTFYKSKILNPAVTGSEKCNFYKILDVIFDNDSFDSIGFYPGESKPDYDMVDNWDLEIEGIANIFGTIKEQDLIDMIVTSTSLESVDGTKIETLLGTIDGSTLISKTFGSVLDNALGSIVNGHDNVSFTYVTSWADEGATLNDIISKFKEGFSGELENIDWLNSDVEKVGNLLKAFSSSQMFGSEDAFGLYLHDLLKGISALETYMKDYGDASDTEYAMSKTDFTNTNWKDTICANEEIDAICGVINAIQGLTGGLDGINSGSFTSAQLETLIIALCDSTSFKTITINAIDNAIKGGSSPISIEGVTLSDANTKFLTEIDNRDEFKKQLLYIPTILGYVESMSINFEDISTFDTGNLDGLLRALEESDIFNTLTDVSKADTYRIDLTCFEQLVSYFIGKTGLSSYYQEGTTVNGRILAVTFNNSYGWNKEESNNDEIDMLINLVNAFKNSGLDNFASGDISGLSEEQIKDLLGSVNHSYILHPSIGGLIKDGYVSLNSTVKNDMFGGAVPNYYLTNITDGTITNEITLYDTEISYVAKLIPFINGDNNFTNIRLINTDRLKEIFDMLAASKVFNTSADYAEGETSRTIKTPFENLIFYSINSTGLTSYYDKSASDEDNEVTLSSRILEVTFDTLDTGKQWISDESLSIVGENDRIINIIKVYQDLDVSTINDATLINLYKTNNTKYNKLIGVIEASYVLNPIAVQINSIVGLI
ncbi:MAG: hypothetical protein ACI311_07160 [Bacilli bacterium]